MATVVEHELADATAAWCWRARQSAAGQPADWGECVALVRQGIRLRRAWDRAGPESPLRRDVLAALAEAQTACHQRLLGQTAQGQPAATRLAESVLAELAEDDRYLGTLLEDETGDPEAVAFAVECFRDDLHWLATQAAVLDGAVGVDFLGRILLEQEAIQREIDAWEDASDGRTPEPLRQAARRLRATALGRRIDALLAMPPPRDWRTWRRAWRMASHLLVQAETPGEALPVEIRRRLAEFRANAAQGWADALGARPSPPTPLPHAGEGSAVGGVSDGDGRAALQAAAEDLTDAGAETLTFLEDYPLLQAARSLEILSEDMGWWMSAARQAWDPALRPSWRTVRRLRRRAEGELQERRLAARMEGLFGRRAVVWWERLILALLVAFIVLLGVEVFVVEELPHDAIVVSDTIAVLAWADLAICAVFLTDFLGRLALAERRALYFWRNWITGLLPAIPFGFVSLYAVHAAAAAEAGEGFILLRALRYLRLPRMARWLRIARPAMRVFRLVAFAVRASDRLVRQLAPLLNRNLVLFERAAIRGDEPPHRAALAALRERFHYRASEAVASLGQAARLSLVQRRIDDLTATLSAPSSGWVGPTVAHEEGAAREIPLDSVVAWLLAATPANISDRIGRRLAQSVARWCRAFDVVGVRNMPVIREAVAAGRLTSPFETTAWVANRAGVLVKGLLDRVYWVADLYGTITAPQLVDSIGEYMVKGSANPARRLIFIGATFLAVTYLATLLQIEALEVMALKLQQLIGTPLIVLGLLCLVPLFLGLWFRRIAGEATDFYTRVAEAQFLAATKRLKSRFARRQHAALVARVIAPEVAIDRVGAAAAGLESDETGQSRQAVELLWLDYLEGAPFHQSDAKTTTQLLGNLALVSIYQTRLRYSRRRRKRLARLDLANSRPSLRGPYLWFRSISRSLAQQTAKLVVDYNAHALPLSRLETAGDGRLARYLDWLARRLELPVDRLPVPPEIAARAAAARGGDSAEANPPEFRVQGFEGSEFTAIHFLSHDRELEDEVRRRYGDAVAELVRSDRRDNIRRLFRTYPLHRLPREARTVNPMTLYQRHLAGGWVLVFPLKVAWWGLLWTLAGLRLMWRVVREVLHPTLSDAAGPSESDPYAVAERKIHRMRAPVYIECMRLRAEFDPEYLGVMLPGLAVSEGRGAASPFEEDLARIAAEPGAYAEFREWAARRRRQMLDLRRWLTRFGLLDLAPRGLRAVAIAYAIDYRGVRGAVEAALRLERAFREVCEARAAEGNRMGIPLFSPRAAFCRVQNRSRMARLFEQPGFRGMDPGQRSACRKLVYTRRGPLVAAVRRLTDRLAPDPVERARRLLEAIGRDPAGWTRQLVVLRAVQTLSVLDLETYRDLAAELGEYGVERA